MVVRVWVVRDGADVADAEGWLSRHERSQAAGLAVDDLRWTFVLSRALQRALGARHLGVPADRVEISRACAHCPDPGHGKPHFTAAPELDYSVSHTRGLIVLAASTGTRVGVDVESGSREIEPAGMARLLASESELRALPSAADREPRELFRLWARKEAVVKLTGHGLLQVPFTALSVDGSVARLDAPPAGWPAGPVHLTDLALGDGAVAALATTRENPEVTVTELTRVADLTL
ncbi:4'-phosphopantetheinyl transferase family protein [Streptomyces griseosporeus]|uniref:4'-phosphopantetheinyl transferase family protein n=1 Tax=Streptomyces griseosporeus TaxID=1910 RepID=UPI0036FF84EE